eukprot:359071-Chlamydomonas_euryale.AAC.2
MNTPHTVRKKRPTATDRLSNQAYWLDRPGRQAQQIEPVPQPQPSPVSELEPVPVPSRVEPVPD